MRGFVRFVIDARVETFNEQVLQRIDYEMKRSADMSVVEERSARPKAGSLRPRSDRGGDVRFLPDAGESRFRVPERGNRWGRPHTFIV